MWFISIYYLNWIVLLFLFQANEQKCPGTGLYLYDPVAFHISICLNIVT